MNATLSAPTAPPPVPKASNPPRPVVLEVNRTGFWHTVATFDAADEAAELVMRDAVELLCALDASTTFRVMPQERHLGALLHYSIKTGWVTP
jgi:hypothetical protein